MSAIYKSAAGRAAVEARTREFLARWPVPNRQFHLPTRAGDTFVVACGPENGQPVILLHGSGANSVMWMGDAAVWAGQFRLYAVDMIGEPGFSAHARPPLASDAYAEWLDDMLAGLSLSRTSLVGISLGGLLAADYATRRPERIDKLALLCPGGIGRQKNFLLKAFPLLFLGSWGRRRMAEMVLGRAPENPTSAEREMGDYVSLIFRHFRPRLERLPRIGDAALARLTMPVLAILGGKDVLLDSADTRRRLETHAPRPEILFLPEEGHLLRGQTATIAAFLAQ